MLLVTKPPPPKPKDPATPSASVTWPLNAAVVTSETKTTVDGAVLLKDRWELISLLGQGAFGQTYAAVDLHTGRPVAVKVEHCLKSKKQVLKLEVVILKKMQNCPHFCRFLACGRALFSREILATSTNSSADVAKESENEPPMQECNYLVMQRLGSNLAALRRKMPGNQFSLVTTALLGKQMIRAIQLLHEAGYLHRDIKPSNFVVGTDVEEGEYRPRVYLIDFGLARRYLQPDGKFRDPREKSGFRGTARYASLQSHSSQELGPRDDLWSLWYVLIEFARGQLPWRKEKDKKKIGDLKRKLTNESLASDLPDQYLLFYRHLESLTSCQAVPDYSYLMLLMDSLLEENGATPDVVFDWDAESDLEIVKVAEKSRTRLSDSNVLLQTSLSKRNDLKSRDPSRPQEQPPSSDEIGNQSSSRSVNQNNSLILAAEEEKRVLARMDALTLANPPSQPTPSSKEIPFLVPTPPTTIRPAERSLNMFARWKRFRVSHLMKGGKPVTTTDNPTDDPASKAAIQTHKNRRALL